MISRVIGFEACAQPLCYNCCPFPSTDFLNSKILSWIAKFDCKATSLPPTMSTSTTDGRNVGPVKSFNYAASFDEFLASITSSNDTDALHHLRLVPQNAYFIVS